MLKLGYLNCVYSPDNGDLIVTHAMPKEWKRMSDKRDPADYVIGDDVDVSDVDFEQEAVYVDGVRLTDGQVEAIAAESVRLAREANLVPGDKSLSGGKKHSPVVQPGRRT